MKRCIYFGIVLLLAASCRNDHEEPQPEPVTDLTQSYSVIYTLPDSTCTSIATFSSERGILPSGYYALCNGGNMGCYASSSTPSTPSTGPSYFYRHTSIGGLPQRTFTLRRPDGSEVINVVNPTVADIHMVNIPASVSRSAGINVHFSAGPLNPGERFTVFLFQDEGHWAVTDSLVGDSMFVFTPADLMNVTNGNAKLSVSHAGRSLPLDQNDGAASGSKRYSSTYQVQVMVNN